MEAKIQLSTYDLHKAIEQFAASRKDNPATHLRADAGKKITLQMVSNPTAMLHPPEWELVVRPDNMGTIEEVVAAMAETEDSARRKLAEALPTKLIYTTDRGEWHLVESHNLLTNEVTKVLVKTVSFTGANEEFKFI